MIKNGLRASALKTYSKPAKVKLFYKQIEDKRKGIVKATDINQQWSGDITYLKVGSYLHYLACHNIKTRMNRPDCCTDNAEIELFFHSLKADLIRENKFKTSSSLRSKLLGF